MAQAKFKAEQTTIDLDALEEYVSATKKISDTKGFSATNVEKVSDTKISATKYMNQYKKDHYDTIRFDVPKGTKALLQVEADNRGMSLTKMIMKSLEIYLDNTRR